MKTEPPIRWDKITRWSERLKRQNEGFAVGICLDDLIDRTSLRARWFRLTASGKRSGSTFRNLVAAMLAHSLEPVVDVPLMRKEFRAGGGAADLELPLRIETLQQHGLFDSWAARYGVTSIVVETKNLARPVGPSCVGQLCRYLEEGQFGSLGFLISANGFTRAARHQLAGLAARNKHLILPLEGKDLLVLLDAAKKSFLTVETFLRRKETLLRQAA